MSERSRVKGANQARRAEGAREQAAGRRSNARTRRGEEERDAQEDKLRELAECFWKGAADLGTLIQVPANVCAEGVRRGESAVSERRA